jgi:HSP20 family protein
MRAAWEFFAKNILKVSNPMNNILNNTIDRRLATVVRNTPWSGLETEIGRIFESALSDFTTSAFTGRFPVDLYEDANNTYVRAELPGLKRDNINVEMADGHLTINGTRSTTAADGQVTESVALNRSIAIPDSVATNQVRAVYEDGILSVTLPKSETAKRRKVAVEIN